MEAASLSSTMNTKEEENLNIPDKMGIQVKTTIETRSPRASTSSSKMKAADVSSECSSGSPAGTRSPNLVARLMGLDLLPASGSPSLLSASRRHSTSNSLTNSHMHPQGQTQKKKHPTRSRQFLQSRSTSCIARNSFFDTDSTTGTLSLPETPRISSARRSDVDHRLSLQINKENIAEEFEISAALRKMGRRTEIKASEDENRNHGHYARHIVNHVRESVSRKVGLDITNTIKSREQRRDDHVVLLKPNRPTTLLTRVGDDSIAGNQLTPSCSPRLRFLDPKSKPVATGPTTKNQSCTSPRFSVQLSPTLENQSQHHQANKILVKLKPHVPWEEQQSDVLRSKQKRKKAGTEWYNSRLRKPPQASDAIRNKKEEPFIRSTATNKANASEKKSKKTPLSNELFGISAPNRIQVKKEPPLPRATLLELDKKSQVADASWRQRSTQLSSCSSRSYKEEETRTIGFQENIRDRCNGIYTSVVDEEYRYIQRILKRTGIDKATPVSQAKWFSPSHPLDPSIFHYIELFHPAATTTTTVNVSKLSQRWSRKLIFQLVDELLVEILKPYINLKPWITPSSPQMDGSQLIDTLCARIGDFPAAKCQVLEDIDALIDKDLRKSEHAYYEEEGESIVSYIEREIVQSLVHETATLVFGFGLGSPYSAADGEQDLTEVTWQFTFT